MAADGAAQRGPKPSASSPTAALTAALESAEATFRAGGSGDVRVMVAFSLGWQMAEIYRPDRRGGPDPGAPDDLPGISSLEPAELQALGLSQVQAGITKLEPSIALAGLVVPNAEEFADCIRATPSRQARRKAIRDFHVTVLTTLTAADFRLGKAYGLGRALADTTRVSPDWRRELDEHRVATLTGWIRELSSALAPHSAHAVAQSLESWSAWAKTKTGDEPEVRGKLAAQGRKWRSLLSGEKQAAEVLETSDYLRAGEGMLKANLDLMVKFVRGYWWLVALVALLLAGGIFLIVGPGSGLAAGIGGASVFTSLGLSWKGIGTSLGKTGARAEEPLWGAALDHVIYERITPAAAVKAAADEKPTRGPRTQVAQPDTDTRDSEPHMSNLQNVERDALRGMAQLLPERWKKIIDLVAEDIPETPTATIPAPTDPAVERLNGIDHIVVLMMENRSFDHMLGYLSLTPELGGSGRTDVDGLTGPAVNVNEYENSSYAIHHLNRTEFSGETEDPDHTGASVDEQLSGNCGGFVVNFGRISAERAAEAGTAAPDPGLVMGYYNAEDLPVYDHLSSEYCVVDRWFSSVPGATWPNRLYALTGRADGTRNDISPPIYSIPAFPRYLDEHNVDWRWYSFDPGTLRAVDPAYRLSHHDRFAFVDSRKLSTRERAAGEFTQEGASFLDDVAAGRLPAVSWIDPHFKDLKVLGPDSNDDHAPSDVLAGQDLVLTLYHALSSAPTWSKTLFVVTYDEHGGFYDHVEPPTVADADPAFRRLGVRVPALVISPLVGKCTSSTSLLGPDFHFDHTSLIKTILTRFCNQNGNIPDMGARMAAANHLGHLLIDDGPRAELADTTEIKQRLTTWDSDTRSTRFTDPTMHAGEPRPLTDFQTGFYDTARKLREAGLPAGHP